MITVTDLTDRFGEAEIAELSDRDGYQQINLQVVGRAISDAESEVESYLNPAGLVSRGPAGQLVYRQSGVVPQPLIIKCCDIARYYLYENGTTEIVATRYRQAIDWLKLVMRNPSMLTGTDTGVGNTSGINSGIVVMPNPRPNNWID